MNLESAGRALPGLRALHRSRNFRGPTRLNWLLIGMAVLAVLAVVVITNARAATAITYTYGGFPTTGAVECLNGDQWGYCRLYPVSSIRTDDANYRNWNDASWSYPPWTYGRVIYTDGAGNWTDSVTAADATQPYVHLGAANSRKAVCSNPHNTNATNRFHCATTTP